MRRAPAAAALMFAVACGDGAGQRRPPMARVDPSAPPSIPAGAHESVPPRSSERVCEHAARTRCDMPQPDYAVDVLPVLRRRCLSCHSGDGVAADEHDFARAETLQSARRTLVDEVSSCAMPPRTPLADEEAEILMRWAACGPPIR